MAQNYDRYRMHSIYRLSDAQPDWNENDPSQPDYIKNKTEIEAGDNISIRREGNKVIISALGGDYVLTDKDKEEIVQLILADFDISDIEGEFAEKVDKIEESTTWTEF